MLFTFDNTQKFNMLGLKKVYRDELLQLALILSLLRVHPESYFNNELFNTVDNLDLDNGTSWRSFGTSILRTQHIHPKSLDSILLNYEREVFADINSLGRYNRGNPVQPLNIAAYLLNVDRTSPNAVHNIQEPIPDIPTPQQQDNDPHLERANTETTATTEDSTLELTQEVNHFILKCLIIVALQQ